MTATDSVRERTGNVSAGTSVFAMIVLEKPLSRLYREIDMVTTPDGHPCAMHNVEEEKIFRPSSWNAFGIDEDTRDYRACAAYGPLYK